MINEEEHLPNTNSFLEGDLFSGIVVAEPVDQDYQFVMGDNHITVSQRAVHLAEDRLCLGFLFLMDRPERFRLDVLIPENCYNANCALNEKELLGFFSKELPVNPEPVITSSCGGKDNHEKITTLKPGAFQSLNFRWESGDVVKFYFYFHSTQENVRHPV